MSKSSKSEQTDKPMTMMEAVRRTLAKLGPDAKPLEIQSEVKTAYGFDMNTNVISAYKSTLKAERKDMAKAAPKPTKTISIKIEGGISVDDIRAIKDVADRIGGDRVKELVEVLGK